MNHKHAIREEDVLDAIQGIYMVAIEEAGGRSPTFTIGDVAWIISDVHHTHPDMETATRSVRWHLGRLKRRGYITKIGNAKAHTRGRPHALYRRTPEGERLTRDYERNWLAAHTREGRAS